MLNVIDADGHVFEHNEVWEQFLEPAYRDRGPKLIKDELGREVYEVEGVRSHTGKEIGPPEGFKAAQHRDGAWDPKARIADMDLQGIDLAALFPGFSLKAEGWLKDPDLSCAVARAYNSWLHSYCQTAPDRLKGLAVLAFKDIPESLKELKRCHDELGFPGVAFAPGALNKSMSDEYFYPIYELAEQLHMPIMCHEGSISVPGVDRFNYRYLPSHTLSHPYEQLVAFMTVIYDGVLEDFPGLNFGFVEAGAGWVPFWVDRMMEHWEKRAAKEAPKMKMSPREYVRSGRVFVSCEAEETTLEMVVKLCGEDLVMYASDYPHWDSHFDSVKEIKELKGITESARQKMLNGNAKRLFGWN